MSAIGWAAAAAGVVLLPVPSGVRGRLSALADAGRLVAAPPRRGKRVSSWLIARWLPVGGGLGTALAAVVAIAAGAALGVTVAVLVVAALLATGAAMRRRTAERGQRALIAAVRALIAELRVGALPAAALNAAAEVSGSAAASFRAAAHAAAEGEPVGLGPEPGDADSSASAGLAAIGQAWRLAEITGAPLGDVLDRVLDDLVAAEAQRDAVRTALAGPRSSAALLAALPALGLLLGALMGAAPLRQLTSTPGGRALCLAGVVLDMAGLAWTRRLARRAEGSGGR